MRTAIIVGLVAVAGIGIGIVGAQELEKRKQASIAEREVKCAAAEKNVMRLVTASYAGGYDDDVLENTIKRYAASDSNSVIITQFETAVAKALIARRDAWKEFVPSKKYLYGYGLTDDYSSLIPVVKPLYKEVCMSM